MRPGGAHNPYVPQIATVEMVRHEMNGVTTLSVSRRSACSATPAPGQFAMLYAFGVGEAAISYSDISRKGLSAYTIQPVGAISSALAQLRAGDQLGVRGPFGRGWPMQEASGRDLLVIAGGLGLAPLRPVIIEAQTGEAAADKVAILYGARTPDHILYTDELEAWRNNGCKVLTTVDSVNVEWNGDVGLVTSLIRRSDFNVNNAVAFVCGPEIMMRFTALALMDAGLPDSRIWLSLERNMKCAIGHCGHCQFGADFICKDGPVFRFDKVRSRLFVREI